jgi:hypothetical protein
MRRRIVIGIAVGLVLAAAGLSLAWYLSAKALAAGVARWTAERQAEGYVISHEPAHIGGFPVALTLRLERPVMEAPGGLWRWEGPTVEGYAWLWDPLRINVSVPGRHVTTTRQGDRVRTYDTDAEKAEGTVELDQGGNFKRLDLDLSRMLLSERGGDSLEIGRADLRARKASTDEEEPRIRFDLRLADLILPEKPRPALGRELARFDAEGEIQGPLPGGRLKEALTRWRDAGGVLELTRVDMRWGPLDLSGDGTLALDDQMRPLAASTVTLRGLDQTLDRLVDEKLVPPREGGLAKAMVGALARPPEGGGPPEVKVPLTLQDGFLFLGPVRLMKLPPIKWE